MDVRVPDEERAIRDAWQSGEHREATRLILNCHGAEVFGFLSAVHGNPDDADDAFALFTERLWATLSRFKWGCSVRTWVYLLARHASVDSIRAEQKQRRPGTVRDSVLAEVATRVRSETVSLLRTPKREALGRLRDLLSEEDRALLVLRIDRRLDWQDVARVFLGDAGDRANATLLLRESTRLRKRYQLVKDRMRTIARSEGLL